MKQLVVAALCAALVSGAARAQGLDEDTRDRGARQLDGWRDRQDANRDGLRYADPNERRPGRRAEPSLHAGGQVRLELSSGGLWHSAKMKDSGDEFEAQGPALLPRVHVGYAVAPNVVLGLHGFWAGVANPTTRAPRPEFADTVFDFPILGSLSLLGFGPEVTLYSASDWSVTFAGALTQLTLTKRTPVVNLSTREVTYHTATMTSHWGYGAAVTLGKEWWIERDVSLGSTLHVTFSANDDASTKYARTWVLGGGLAMTFE